MLVCVCVYVYVCVCGSPLLSDHLIHSFRVGGPGITVYSRQVRSLSAHNTIKLYIIVEQLCVCVSVVDLGFCKGWFQFAKCSGSC